MIVSPRHSPAKRARLIPSVGWKQLLGLAALGALSALSVSGSAAESAPTGALSTLGAVSDAVQDLARRVHPCVVKVVAMGYLGAEDGSLDQGSVSRGQSSGSGVVIDPDGYIVTNAHVLGGADHAQVTLPASAPPSGQDGWNPGAGKILEAQVVGIDAEVDIALLKVPETGLPFLPLTLGIFVADMDTDLAEELSQSRGEGGVLVVATLGETPAIGEDLRVGDIIYGMNRHRVSSSARLRELVNAMKPGDPLAFQIEREGRLRFVAAEIP
jgi:S1-C subfamily serine protease